MYHRFHRPLTFILLPFMIAACATTPTVRAPSPEHVATAKRFLAGFDAGELAMVGFRRKLEEEATKQPGMVELVRRAFADITAEDFEDLIARVYARNLSREHLAELARFTENPTGNRFFRMAIAGALEGKQLNAEDAMRQFNADELTEIMNFALSDAFAAMEQALPTINREIADEGHRFGEARLREYLKKQ
jgi:hypothetical protein